MTIQSSSPRNWRVSLAGSILRSAATVARISPEVERRVLGLGRVVLAHDSQEFDEGLFDEARAVDGVVPVSNS